VQRGEHGAHRHGGQRGGGALRHGEGGDAQQRPAPPVGGQLRQAAHAERPCAAARVRCGLALARSAAAISLANVILRDPVQACRVRLRRLKARLARGVVQITPCARCYSDAPALLTANKAGCALVTAPGGDPPRAHFFGAVGIGGGAGRFLGTTAARQPFRRSEFTS